MADIVDPLTRSRMMAGIKGRNTKPELLIRSLLHRMGFRFRLHVKDLPGKPDIVLPKYRAIIFVNGCFWHGHNSCHLFKLPKTRPEFWENKILKNQANDIKAIAALQSTNWRICIIWECSIKGAKTDPQSVIINVANWLKSSESFLEISVDNKHNLVVTSQ